MTIGGTACADRSLVYLNNRYHDPTLGAFISVDPLVEKTREPYIYASGNPATWSDPTGLETFGDLNDNIGYKHWVGPTLTSMVKVMEEGDDEATEAYRQQLNAASKEHHDKPGIEDLFESCSIKCAAATTATAAVFGSLTAVACPSGTIATAGFGAIGACGGMAALAAAATSAVHEKLSDEPPIPMSSCVRWPLVACSRRARMFQGWFEERP